MAQTKRDSELKSRINSLCEQLTNEDKTSDQIIEFISGLCGISLRTSSEHYRGWKAQKTLLEMGFKEQCTHSWGNAFCTPSGLTKQCLRCGITKEVSNAE